MALLATGAAQGSIWWWVRHHRAHHRYLDTDQDPYDARKGLFWSHIGWLLTIRDRKNWGKVDLQDARNDRVVQWQRRNYKILSPVMILAVPVLTAHLGWNDWKGGLFYSVFGRCVVNWHLTFSVNSLAHWVGDQPYSDRNTSRQLAWMALLTVGESYHNFHHEFPSDYRNGPFWYDIDLSKWAIAIWAKLGWVTHVNRASRRDIETCRSLQDLKKHGIIGLTGTDSYGSHPVWEWDEYMEKVRQGHYLVAISGIVYEVKDFISSHPGGEKLIRDEIGKDATWKFHGGIYNHSAHAQNLLNTMKVAIIHGRGAPGVVVSNQGRGSKSHVT